MDVASTAAIVTGGHSGMGFAAARALAQRGAKVAILGRRPDRVAEKAGEIGALGLACDVSDPEAVEAAFSEAERKNGTARILIHAAALGFMQMLLKPDGSPSGRQSIYDTMETNVLGTIFVNQSFASRLTKMPPPDNEPRGILINVSSIGAADGVMGAVYAASKGAVDALCLSVARELSEWRIRVCTISPGGVDTEMLRQGGDSTYALIGRQVPGLFRPGTPDEFAALALHLCENDYLNGVNVRFDGGMRIPFSYEIGSGVAKPVI